MIDGKVYGINRSLVPKHTNLEKAWKISTERPILDNEVLIDVEVINLNKASFVQIYESSFGQKEDMIAAILKIVNERGKLHNPVTGTGGMLQGTIVEMGREFKKKRDFKIGDSVISLVSLIATPLVIDEIKHIDYRYGQIFVKGYAILFRESPIIKTPLNLPLNVSLAALDIAGTPATVADLVNKNQKVLILGAGNRSGFLSALAARNKLKDTGELVGVALGENGVNYEYRNLFDRVWDLNFTSNKDLFNNENVVANYYDLIVDCSSTPHANMFINLLVKSKGAIYVTQPSNKPFDISYTAESLGKDVRVQGYKGYSDGHAEYTLELLEKKPNLIKIFERLSVLEYEERNTESSKETIYIPTDEGMLKNFVMKSDSIKNTVKNAIKVSKFDCTVLITGESGVGKEMIAKIIYSHSKRVNSPYVRLNCASIPENLLESELFGYEKGAFTGARQGGKTGLWEMAAGGIILLDEIGELPLMLQAKLLRVLQENEFYRVGGTVPIQSDVRVLAITNKNLAKMVSDGKFREDLYYRLNVFPIYVPALRYRRDDIPDLINVFVHGYNKKFNLNKRIDREVIDRMAEFNWKGNIRELENFVQRLLIEEDNDVVNLESFHKCINVEGPAYQEYQMQRNLIDNNEDYKAYMDKHEKNLLKHFRDKGMSTREMAKRLNISQASVSRKLNRYEL